MSDDPSKKILIDEDWKTRVEAEKEAARLAETTESPKAEATSAAKPAAGGPAPKAPAPAAPEPELPPPDLVFLASTLYMQALVALGLVPNPVSRQAQVSLPQAKHAIDSLEMLQAKTEGNRTPDETQAIDHMLHELRLTFVEVRSK